MRLLIAFAAGAPVLSVTLALITYGLARSYLLDQRQTLAQSQTEVDARLVAGALRSAKDVPQLLGSLQGPSGSTVVLFHDQQWFTSSLDAGRDAIPTKLRDLVVSERGRGRARFVLGGDPRLAIGLPLPNDDAYFEIFPLHELDRTLRTLRNSLVAGSGVTLAGAILVGVWGSRRILAPLAEVGETATSIAAGQLEARLDVGRDRELAALATSFNRMVDTLQERIERDARFASNVSHELRSPLTALKSAMQLIQSRRSEFDPRMARNLDLLGAQVARFERLVQDLLEISRFDAGVVQASLEEAYIGELVLQTLQHLDGRPVPVEVAASATDLIVEVDKRRLEQVIANLVSNAERHGGGLERILVEGVDGHARIVVEDAGPGVPPAERERIFERFQRSQRQDPRAAGGTGGVGLGLALVAEHVRLHHGVVRVEDRPGGGARFVVELPVKAP